MRLSRIWRIKQKAEVDNTHPRLVPAVVLTLEASEMPTIIAFTTKTTQPRPQVFSANMVR